MGPEAAGLSIALTRTSAIAHSVGMRILMLHTIASLAVAMPAAAHAQKPSKGWKEIGKTSAGNIVSFNPASVKKSKGITSATLQVTFTTPTTVGNDKWYLSRHEAMFDCAKHTIASKLNVYYGDPKATKVVKRDVIKIPGFGPAIGGSMAQVAMDYFCK